MNRNQNIQQTTTRHIVKSIFSKANSLCIKLQNKQFKTGTKKHHSLETQSVLTATNNSILRRKLASFLLTDI